MACICIAQQGPLTTSWQRVKCLARGHNDRYHRSQGSNQQPSDYRMNYQLLRHDHLRTLDFKLRTLKQEMFVPINSFTWQKATYLKEDSTKFRLKSSNPYSTLWTVHNPCTLPDLSHYSFNLKKYIFLKHQVCSINIYLHKYLHLSTCFL